MEYIITLKGDVRPMTHCKSLEDAMGYIIKNKLMILSFIEFGHLSIIFAEDINLC